jgi:hypothetical protein
MSCSFPARYPDSFAKSGSLSGQARVLLNCLPSLPFANRGRAASKISTSSVVRSFKLGICRGGDNAKLLQ